MRAKNTSGGGANTTLFGKKFESDTDLAYKIYTYLDKYTIHEKKLSDNKKTKVFEIYTKNDSELVGEIYQQARLYDWLAKNNIDYKTVNSKQWRPDEAFVNYRNKTLYIIEKKFQQSTGSVEEKVFGFPNKRRFYQRLVNKLNYHVEFIFLGNSEYWCQDSMQDYIIAMREDGVRTMFDDYEYEWLGLY